jgi:tetratricopeptide (TPR) repeat protein
MKHQLILIVLMIIFKAEAQSSASSMADSLYLTGSYTLAINAYAKMGNDRTNLQIARAYQAIGNLDKAISQYESIVTENPALQIAAFELGKLYLRANAYDEARKLFSKLATSGSENPEYQYYLGEAYRELGQQASSLISYKNAIQKDSTHLRSLFQLAKFFTVKQQRDQALEYINQGLEFYSNDVALVNLKALVNFNDDQYTKAITWFEKVLALGERKEYVYEKLAYCYYKNWEFVKAKDTYKELLKLNDDNSDTYFSLAEVYRKNKELDSAEVFIKKAMEIKKPIFATGYNALAGLARERSDLTTALSYYEKAHAQEPMEPRYYYQICTLNDQLAEDPERKLEYYENFIKLYGSKQPYVSQMVARRISELKEEIHFSQE